MTAYVRRVKGRSGTFPRWMGGRMPLSTALAAAVRDRLGEARHGIFAGPEMVRERLGLLPAFGAFTGGGRVRPRRGDRVWALAEGEVVEVGAG